MPSGHASLPPQALAIARALLADATTQELTAALGDAGIRCILLKGASLAHWLYDHVSMRPYVDSDLLVAPGNIAAAEAVLAGLGFEHAPLDDIPHDLPWHAHAWLRARDGANVDLHRTLIGAGVEPEEVWQVLSAETERLRVGTLEVEVLTKPARALHVALHAAQDGGLEKPLQDLRQAVDRLPDAMWEDAARLAERLRAGPALGAGLRLHPAGEALASRLGLPVEVPLAVELRASGAPRSALSLEWLTRIPGAGAKTRYVARKLFPPKEFMRAWSPPTPRGPARLAVSYVRRLVWLAGATRPAISSWREARRTVAGEAETPAGTAEEVTPDE